MSDNTDIEEQDKESKVIPLTWVEVDCKTTDEGGFSGQVSRHLITNALYAQYLNQAFLEKTIVIKNLHVKGAKSKNLNSNLTGKDFYKLQGPGWTALGATEGGKSRINFKNTVFNVHYFFRRKLWTKNG